MARWDFVVTLKERVDKHDREIAAIKKLILTGMKMLTRIEGKVYKLADSQLKTDQQLQLLIQSLSRGNGNGHKDKRIA